MKQRRLLPGILLFLAVALSVSAFAAYIGRGSKKGVLVATSNYFESDVMARVNYDRGNVTESGILTELNKHPVTCVKGLNGETVKAISIRNYKSTMEFDLFDVEYQLKLWLSSGSSYEYFYRFKTDEESGWTDWSPITATTYAGAEAVSGMLKSDKTSSNSLEVMWRWTGDGEEHINLAAHIHIVAEPVSPDYLEILKLGTVLNLGTVTTTSTVFTCNAGFYKPDANETGSLDKYAGFIYRVKTTGIPTNEDTITIKWNSDKLELSSLYAPEYTVTTDTAVGTTNGWSMLTFRLEGNKITDLVFYRKYPGWGTSMIEGTEESDETMSVLSGMVVYEVVGTTSP